MEWPRRAVVACRDVLTLELVAVTLTRDGFEVRIAPDAAAVAVLCNAKPPDLLVCQTSWAPLQQLGQSRLVVLDDGTGPATVPPGTMILPQPFLAPALEQALAAWNMLGAALPPLDQSFAVALPAEAAVDGPEAASATSGLVAAELPESVPRAGDLTRVPLVRLLFELHISGFSGALLLERGAATRRLLFRRGIVSAVSGGDEDTYLARLVATGALDQEKRTAVAALAQESGCSETEATLELGYLSAKEMLIGLAEHRKTLLVEVAVWRDATYRIDTDVAAIRVAFGGAVGGAFDGAVNPLLVLPAIVRSMPTPELLRALGGFAKQYIAVTERFRRYSALVAALPGFDAPRLLSGKMTYQRAFVSDDAHASDIAQGLYILTTCQLVRGSTTPVAAPPPAAAAPPPPATSQSVLDYRALSSLIELIDRTHAQLAQLDYFTLLAVGRDCSNADVDAAVGAVRQLMYLDALPAGLGADVEKRADDIRAYLDRARGTLTDEVERARYVGTLS